MESQTRQVASDVSRITSFPRLGLDGRYGEGNLDPTDVGCYNGVLSPGFRGFRQELGGRHGERNLDPTDVGCYNL